MKHSIRVWWLVPVLILFYSWGTGVRAESRKVLIVGDSQSTGVFGDELDRLVRAQVGDANVNYYASCGSSPQTWFEGRVTTCGYVERHPNAVRVSRRESATPLIEGLLATHSVSAIVVQMGGNLIGKGVETAAKEADRLASLLASKGLPCVWIGPPHGTKRLQPLTDQVVAKIRETMTPRCAFINSYEFGDIRYPEGAGDGIHYDQAGVEGKRLARSWANQAFSAFPAGFLGDRAVDDQARKIPAHTTHESVPTEARDSGGLSIPWDGPHEILYVEGTE